MLCKIGNNQIGKTIRRIKTTQHKSKLFFYISIFLFNFFFQLDFTYYLSIIYLQGLDFFNELSI